MAGKLGRSYINLKKYNKAYPVFSGIFQQDSTNVYWNKQFAFCAYHTGKKEEAIKLYNKVLEQNPRDYTSWLNLIKLCTRQD